MITTITTFQLPKPVTREEARSIFLSTAPTYQGVAGLFRKCYVRSQDGNSVGAKAAKANAASPSCHSHNACALTNLVLRGAFSEG